MLQAPIGETSPGAMDPLAAILGANRVAPPPTWSLVVTVFGDAVVPRGGSLWLGTLLALFSALDVGEGAVRTAMSRLAQDGWLERRRVGRNSFYRLAEQGRRVFADAAEHIYTLRPPAWDGQLTLLMFPGSDEPARAALSAAGFGNASPGLHVAPPGVPIPDEAASAIRLAARCEPDDARRLAALAWRLDRMANGYRRLVDLFEPLARQIASGRTPDPLTAMAARILLIHRFRRIVLHDPVLPSALLPMPWPGDEARALCAELYRALLPASERWLDAHGLDEFGPLPPPTAALDRRFR